jgi:hypothetical protein
MLISQGNLEIQLDLGILGIHCFSLGYCVDCHHVMCDAYIMKTEREISK